MQEVWLNYENKESTTMNCKNFKVKKFTKAVVLFFSFIIITQSAFCHKNHCHY